MNDQAKISMNAAQRSALRKAITAHSGWKRLREMRAYKIEELSTGQLLDVAYDLGIEPDTYMSAESITQAEKAFDDGLSLAPAKALYSGDTVGAGAALASLIGQIAGQSMSREAIEAMVDARLNEALKNHTPVVRLECKGADGQIREVQGHKHPAFAKLARAAILRLTSGYTPNIYIAGPAGSGKTFAGHQLADSLGLPFHLNGAIGQEYQLLGFIDAAGTYHHTPFREAYEHGGVYMFDEVDASDNSAILALNAALANGRATFPDATIARHPDCIIVASANTWGLGATADYVGRAKLDAAFLSRFPVKLHWDYDTALEINISGHEGFARRVIDARARARSAGLKVVIDPRHSQAGAALIAAGMQSDEAAELTYLANLNADQRKIVEGR